MAKKVSLNQFVHHRNFKLAVTQFNWYNQIIRPTMYKNSKFKTMKKKLKILVFALIMFSVVPLGCKKVNQSNLNDEALLSDEIQKIETIYKQGDIKYEGFVEGGNIETNASQAYKDKIKMELEKSYSKQVSYLKNGGNLVAVFKDGTCGNYAELWVSMDAEDSSPASYYQGYTGDSYVSTPYYNVLLDFCVVDNAYFERTDVDYAILTLTTALPVGVSRICRYLDNEDTGNGNLTTYDGSTFSGWFGDCWFGGNTRLSFFYYPSSSYQSLPSLGIDYGVLGHFGEDGTDNGFIYIDDENTRNADWCYRNLWNGSGWTSGYIGNTTNIMDVGSNTKFYISKGIR